MDLFQVLTVTLIGLWRLKIRFLTFPLKVSSVCVVLSPSTMMTRGIVEGTVLKGGLVVFLLMDVQKGDPGFINNFSADS